MTCERCGGFKVFDYFDGPFHCTGFRCINCGAITGTCRFPCRCRPVSSPSQRIEPKPVVVHYLVRLHPELPMRVRQKISHESTPRAERAGWTRTGTPERTGAKQFWNQKRHDGNLLSLSFHRKPPSRSHEKLGRSEPVSSKTKGEYTGTTPRPIFSDTRGFSSAQARSK